MHLHSHDTISSSSRRSSCSTHVTFYEVNNASSCERTDTLDVLEQPAATSGLRRASSEVALPGAWREPATASRSPNFLEALCSPLRSVVGRWFGKTPQQAPAAVSSSSRASASTDPLAPLRSLRDQERSLRHGVWHLQQQVLLLTPTLESARSSVAEIRTLHARKAIAVATLQAVTDQVQLWRKASESARNEYNRLANSAEHWARNISAAAARLLALENENARLREARDNERQRARTAQRLIGEMHLWMATSASISPTTRQELMQRSEQICRLLTPDESDETTL